MTTASTDRNLLFGILALQMDFISRDALIKAMNAWVLEKTKGLGQILVEQKALGSERHALLEALVQEHLKQHGNDPEQSLAAVSSVGSIREELQQIADADLHASLAHVSAAHQASEDSWGTHAPASVGTPTSSGLRFRILRPHAKGGLGQVSVARDEELHREVALKEIQDRHADDPDSRARFVVEAEITGGLEHPGIVPVYGLGTYADGRPYYAMRFIRGDSLQEAIEQFHRADGPKRDPGERTLALRKLLGRFIDTCNAIAYAHSRGVLHRDLKPGNIMLGKYGETLVVDWGLAKMLGRTDESSASEEAPLQTSPARGSAKTMPGSAVGTPQFMSPEQAAGRLDLLGPATDVYSLGATLYALLTGQAPVTGPDVPEILHKVQRGDFPRPRHVKKLVPAALEAICLKAMALKPTDRYASPRAAADDLEHWLADEPVSAYRDPLKTRLWRWVRRHRTLVGSAAAAMGAVFLTVVVAFVLINQAKNEAIRLKNEAIRLATDNAFLAEKEGNQRKRAEEQQALAEQGELTARRNIYVVHLQQADLAWQQGDVGRVIELLEEDVPKTHQRDVRGFEWHYLYRLCHAELRTLRAAHARYVHCVAFSPDGRWLVSGGQGHDESRRDKDFGEVKVWDAATGRELLSLEGHTYDVRGVAVSPDGRRIASASVDATVRIWDAATGRELVAVPKAHALGVYSVAFSPDGRWIATGGADESADGVIKIWDAANGAKFQTLSGHTANQIFCVAFSPDGQTLASAGADGTVKLWDPAGKREHRTFIRLTSTVKKLAYSPDGNRLASVEFDGPIRIWDIASGRQIAALPAETSGDFRGVAFSPDGDRLAASFAKEVKIWDVSAKTRKEIARREPLRTFRGHTSWVEGLAFSPDGCRLASAGDETIKVWDTGGDVGVRTLRTNPEAVVFSPDGSRLASANVDHTVKVWDTASGQELRTLHGHTFSVRCVAFSPDGQRLVSAGRHHSNDDGEIIVWDLASEQKLHTLRVFGVRCAAFSPDGKRLVSGGGIKDTTGDLKVWDAANAQELLTLEGHTNVVNSVVFSPDGTRIASVSEDAKVKLWDAANGRELRTLAGGDREIRGVRFSPDGKLLAACSGAGYPYETDPGQIMLWEAASGKKLPPIAGHALPIYGIAFSPDGLRLVSASKDKTVKVWDVASRQLLLTLPGHMGGLSSVEYSPDGWRLATSSFDNTIKVWDGRPSSRDVREESEALGLVDFLFGRPLLKVEVSATVRNHQSLTPAVRRKAVQLIEVYRDNPERFDVVGWALACQSGLPRVQYERALHCSEIACRLAPDNALYLETLGIAQYRMGASKKALAALTRADELDKDSAHILAFLAMAHQQCGQKEQAAAAYARFVEAMKKPQWAEEETAQAFEREARELLK